MAYRTHFTGQWQRETRLLFRGMPSAIGAHHSAIVVCVRALQRWNDLQDYVGPWWASSTRVAERAVCMCSHAWRVCVCVCSSSRAAPFTGRRVKQAFGAWLAYVHAFALTWCLLRTESNCGVSWHCRQQCVQDYACVSCLRFVTVCS